MHDKVLIRDHVRVKGWDVPELPINLVSKYLDACEAHKVTANTGVVAQLLLRTRILQPLPYHQVDSDHQENLLSTLWAHLDVANSGQVSSKCLKEACLIINPRLSWDDFGLRLSYSMPVPDEKGDPVELYGTGAILPPPSEPFTLPPLLNLEQFMEALTLAAEGVSNEDLQQGVLELCAFQVLPESCGREELLKAAFREMDARGQGYITAEALRMLAAALGPGHHRASRSNEDVPAMHPLLTKPRFTNISLDEFLSLMTELCKEVTDKNLELAVYEMLCFSIRPPWEYDFSRDYIGSAGLPPLMDALDYDPTFTGLRLRKCGVGNEGAHQLSNWLSKRPGVRVLDLRDNPISDKGCLQLIALLQANRSLCEVMIDGCDVMRAVSRTHHNALGPSPAEGARPLFNVLASNNQQRVALGSEVVAALRNNAPEVKALVYSLADETGRAPLPDLQDALKVLVDGWGFLPSAVDTVICSEALLGAASQQVRDASGVLRVRYAEFMHFLRTNSRAAAVAAAVRQHRLEVKVDLFKSIYQETDSAPLSAIKERLSLLVRDYSAGWGISNNDLEEVLVPHTFLRSGGLDLPDVQSGGNNDQAQEFCLSWASFFNTLMFIYNAS